MIKLNLPAIESTLKKADGKVWILDVIRKKYVVLTPEEWVRQHFIHYLISHARYPKALITVESGLQVNTMQRRSDIVVYARDGKPWMVVECKAPDLPLTNQVVQQVAAYNTTFQAPYVCITNGMQHHCYHIDYSVRQTTWLNNLPSYE